MLMGAEAAAVNLTRDFDTRVFAGKTRRGKFDPIVNFLEFDKQQVKKVFKDDGSFNNLLLFSIIY